MNTPRYRMPLEEARQAYRECALTFVANGRTAGQASRDAVRAVELEEEYTNKLVTDQVKEALRNSIKNAVGVMFTAKVADGHAALPLVQIAWERDMVRRDVDVWEPAPTTSVTLTFDSNLNTGDWADVITEAVQDATNEEVDVLFPESNPFQVNPIGLGDFQVIFQIERFWNEPPTRKVVA